MVNLPDLTDKEQAFLGSMVDVSDTSLNINPSEAKAYKSEHGCDPCDACGPAACADCNACATNYISHGQLNPFTSVSG